MLLEINPLASSPTPTQIATNDIRAFNEVASMIHERMLNGIPGQDQTADQQGRIIAQARPKVTAEEYCQGLVVALGDEAFGRLKDAANVLSGQTQITPA